MDLGALEIKPEHLSDILPAYDYDGVANHVLAAVVSRVNAHTRRELEKAPKVRVKLPRDVMHPDGSFTLAFWMDATHTARLVCIEEIGK
jgi:hypothetical protein